MFVKSEDSFITVANRKLQNYNTERIIITNTDRCWVCKNIGHDGLYFCRVGGFRVKSIGYCDIQEPDIRRTK